LQQGHAFTQAWLRRRPCHILGRLQVQRDARKELAKLIVQLSRQVTPFLLLYLE
jgi:hypothetical protein